MAPADHEEAGAEAEAAEATAVAPAAARAATSRAARARRTADSWRWAGAQHDRPWQAGHPRSGRTYAGRVTAPAPRTYEVRTYGCQMNVHDSERISGLLDDAGYVPAPPGGTADVVVLNTCAVPPGGAGT